MLDGFRDGLMNYCPLQKVARVGKLLDEMNRIARSLEKYEDQEKSCGNWKRSGKLQKAPRIFLHGADRTELINRLLDNIYGYVCEYIYYVIRN